MEVFKSEETQAEKAWKLLYETIKMPDDKISDNEMLEIDNINIFSDDFDFEYSTNLFSKLNDIIIENTLNNLDSLLLDNDKNDNKFESIQKHSKTEKISNLKLNFYERNKLFSNSATQIKSMKDLSCSEKNILLIETFSENKKLLILNKKLIEKIEIIKKYIIFRKFDKSN